MKRKGILELLRGMRSKPPEYQEVLRKGLGLAPLAQLELAGTELLLRPALADIAKKLRAGESLSRRERLAAADALEKTPRPRQARRGRPQKFGSTHDRLLYDMVVEYCRKHPGSALTRDKAFGAVAALFTTKTMRVTPSAVERAYLREKGKRAD